ncbi:MAG: DUF4172 domain-containing protein [Yoonia sp.]|nr:DUF4172 domain-containing protein [Yoonia sp.]
MAKHVKPDEPDQLRIDLLSEEAIKTGAIEGESLNDSYDFERGLGPRGGRN